VFIWPKPHDDSRITQVALRGGDRICFSFERGLGQINTKPPLSGR
jgi:hypothetical protein